MRAFFSTAFNSFSKASPGLLKRTPRTSPKEMARMAPIETLPYEILSKIFTDVLLLGDWWDPVLATWLVTIMGVNTHWHNVAMSNPSLWSRIVVNYSPGFNSSGRRVQTRMRIKAYLTRSNPHPFHVILRLAADVQPLHVSYLWNVIKDELYRCRSITLELDSDAQAAKIFPLPPLVSRLHSILCHISRASPDESRFRVLCDNNDAPLEELSWTSSRNPDISNALTKYLRLRSIHGGYTKDSVTLKTLERFSSLTHFRWYTISDVMGEIEPPPIELTSLKYLSLLHNFQRPHFNAPNLLKLTIHSYNMWGQPTPDLRPGDFPQLQHLELIELSVEQERLYHFLQAVPTVIHCKFTSCTILYLLPLFQEMTRRRRQEDNAVNNHIQQKYVALLPRVPLMEVCDPRSVTVEARIGIAIVITDLVGCAKTLWIDWDNDADLSRGGSLPDLEEAQKLSAESKAVGYDVCTPWFSGYQIITTSEP
ncbi:hypothetical protein DL93DRAFT_1420418 [Clavulina sp. PMI_390]|nr:hypothetical protein DL93DRAFT_1420418 [Clavulina sp. PMI_390]